MASQIDERVVRDGAALSRRDDVSRLLRSNHPIVAFCPDSPNCHPIPTSVAACNEYPLEDQPVPANLVLVPRKVTNALPTISGRPMARRRQSSTVAPNPLERGPRPSEFS